ncbi:Uncharacterised protein [Vibrio cholerae]|nr:Uncharacterised protein [Vibrio cholerae]
MVATADLNSTGLLPITAGKDSRHVPLLFRVW